MPREASLWPTLLVTTVRPVDGVQRGVRGRPVPPGNPVHRSESALPRASRSVTLARCLTSPEGRSAVHGRPARGSPYARPRRRAAAPRPTCPVARRASPRHNLPAGVGDEECGDGNAGRDRRGRRLGARPRSRTRDVLLLVHGPGRRCRLRRGRPVRGVDVVAGGVPLLPGTRPRRWPSASPRLAGAAREEPVVRPAPLSARCPGWFSSCPAGMGRTVPGRRRMSARPAAVRTRGRGPSGRSRRPRPR